MKKEEVINALYQGDLVECTKKEYEEEIRTIIQDQAGKFIDENDSVRGMIALEEVRRLDEKFKFEIL